MTLLRTRLAPPIAAGGFLSRPTLIEGLLSPRRLVLVSAPAGWGKTSLLAAWSTAKEEGRRFAFVRLLPGDEVVQGFWSYLIEALRTLVPDLAPDVDPVLRQSVLDPFDEVIPKLVNGLADLAEPIVLVLDDYHVVTNDAVHDGVANLIDNLPVTVSLAISTRSDPPLPLARLRASGDLLEIRADHLAFGFDEIGTFLRERFDVRLGDDEIQRLLERTEGWPAGVQLAGISLEHSADPTAFLARFAGDDRNVADYLVSEVMGTLDPGRSEFLLRTSVLEELSGPLCDAVTERHDSATLLDELEHDGLFVIPLDRQRRWYRYHHLFRDWLRHELQASDPESIPEIHRRAAGWYASDGSLDAAVEHALAGRDLDRAGELVARSLDAREDSGGALTWRWFDQLPDEIAARHPSIALARSRIAMETGALRTGRQWAETAEAGLEALPPTSRAALAPRVKLWLALAHLTTGELEAALVQAQEVANSEQSVRSADYAGAIGIAGIATFWVRSALEAIPALTEAASARSDTGVADAGVTALLALACAEVGDWSTAQAMAERALSIPRIDERSRYPEELAAHYALGLIAVANGDRAGGLACIDQGLELARGWVEPIFIAYGCLLRSDATSDFSEKRALLREARQLAGQAEAGGRIIELIEAAARKVSLRQEGRSTSSIAFLEPLTDRELDVLQLLRSDLSQREIADELYLAHSTVKSYTKAIYRKLGVSSREAAIETARSLDLI